MKDALLLIQSTHSNVDFGKAPWDECIKATTTAIMSIWVI